MAAVVGEEVWIYHERQEARLCGQHALNNLAQSTVFSVAQLAEIAHQLDYLERGVMEKSAAMTPSANVDEAGNFSIQVLKAAVEHEYPSSQLLHLAIAMDRTEHKDITELQGFLCHKSDHWFAIRQVGGRFWNLNSTNERPFPISHFQVATEMEKWKQEGYTIFAIPSGLPSGGLKQDFGMGGSWHLMTDLLKGKSTAADPWKDLQGSGMRLDGGNNNAMSDEDAELQLALKASLETASTGSGTLPEVPNEPAEGTPGAVRLQLRLPGKRVVRRFLETDSVKTIYAVCSKESGQKMLGLRYGYPPKDLFGLQGMTIGEAKLSGETIQGRYV